MRIESISLKNWGPHRSLTLNMDAPVVGFIGPNGSGKSNILSAISFGFTGLLDKDRTQASYVTQLEGEDSPNNGSVDITFRKNGIKGRIYRQVGVTAARKLWWDGADKPLTKSSEVEKLMGEILSCDRQAIQTAVFLSQGHIGDFLFSTDSKREDSFAKACMIDHLGRVPDIVAGEVQRLSKQCSNQTSTRDEATLNLENANAALTLARDNLEALPDHSPLEALLKTCVSERTAFQRAENALSLCRLERDRALETAARLQPLDPPSPNPDEEVDQLDAEIERIREARRLHGAARKDLDTAAERQARLEAVCSTIETIRTKTVGINEVAEKAATLQEKITAARKGIDNHRKRATLVQQRGEAHEEGCKINTELASIVLPVEGHVEKLREDIGSLMLRKAGLEFASSHHTHGASSCPVCGSVTVKDLPGPEECRQLLLEVDSRLQERHAQVTACNNTTARCAHLKQQLESLRTKWVQLGSEIDKLPPEEPLLTDEQISAMEQELLEAINRKTTLTYELQRIDSLETERNQIQAALQSLNVGECTRIVNETVGLINEDAEGKTARRQAITRWLQASRGVQDEVKKAEGAFAAAAKSLDDCKIALEVATRKVTEKSASFKLENLDAAVAEVLERISERNRAEGEVRNAVGNVRAAEKRLREVEQKIADEQYVQWVISQLEIIRTAFGRSGIQRRYLSQLFESIVGLTQHHLSSWDADFNVERDPENLFNFLFTRSAAPTVLLDQSQMSGGQRIRLSLSFVQSVQQIVYPGLEFLCVDEPSTHLDQDGVEGLARLFRTIADRTESTEAQVLVVDHDPRLMQAFSICHRLDKLGDS